MFWQVLGDVVPLALGVILSPLPIAGVIALLLAPRGRSTSIAFTIAFFAGTLVVTGAAAFGTWGTEHSNSFLAGLIRIVLGFALAALFFYLAWRSFRGRARKGEEPKEPKWLASIESLGVVRASGLGLFIGVVNLKNLPIELSVGATAGTAGLPWQQVLVIVLIFSAAASLGILVPTLIGQSRGPAVTNALRDVKEFLIRHNPIILAVLFAILGAIQLGKAISGLGA